MPIYIADRLTCIIVCFGHLAHDLVVSTKLITYWGPSRYLLLNPLSNPSKSVYPYVFFVTNYVAVTLLFLFLGATTPSGQGFPNSRGFYITHDAPHSVELLWTSDQLVAESSTWQHTTLTTDKHPCPRWDSNPQSQQASGRRTTPYTTRLLGPA